jgi:Bax protein
MENQVRNWAFIFLVACSLVLAGCFKNKSFQISTVKAATVKVESLSQIVLLNDSLVKPILYTHVNGLNRQPTEKAKALFVSVILPSILVAKHELIENRRRVAWMMKKSDWESNDSLFYVSMKSRYRATDITDLLQRMVVLPNSLILAQAALESGWGQSYFFLNANNVFGVWSYDRSEPRMQAGLNRSVHLKVYNNVSHSITDYFEVLGRARYYRGLREACLNSADSFMLLPHLKYYSIGRERYTNALKKMIIENDFTKYDHFQIDPDYLVEG